MQILISLDTLVTCPKSNQTFPLKEGITGQVLSKLVAKTKASQAAELESVKAQIRSDMEQAFKHDAKLREKALRESLEAEKALAQKRFAGQQVRVRELQEEKVALELKFEQAKEQAVAEAQKGLDAERAKIRRELKASLQSELTAKEKALGEKVAEADAMQKSFVALTAEFQTALKEKAELKMAVSTAKLEAAKDAEAKLEADRKRIRNEVEEAARLKLVEKDKAIEALKRDAEEMKRKAEQGSMQAQGEAAEVVLRQDLVAAFVNDQIVDVKTGKRGADILQRVRSARGRDCGSILWESKDTKTWQAAWLAKLERDRLAAGADLAVLVSRIFPKEHADADSFQHGNIWVVTPQLAVVIGSVLREILLQLSNQKAAQLGRQNRSQLLFDLISDRAFAGKFENILNLVGVMQKCLDQEERAIQKHWKKRHLTIQQLTAAVTGMLGDLCAVGNGSLKELEQIAGLDLLDDESEDITSLEDAA